MNTGKRLHRIEILRKRIKKIGIEIKMLCKPLIAAKNKRVKKYRLKQEVREKERSETLRIRDEQYARSVERLHRIRLAEDGDILKNQVAIQIANFKPHKAVYYDGRDVDSIDAYKAVMVEMYGPNIVEPVVIN